MKTMHTVLLLSSLFASLHAYGLNPSQKLVAEALTNIFEFNTIELDYARCDNLQNDHGYTLGRSDFTTDSADAYDVIRQYKGMYASKFAPYLPILAAHSASKDKSLNGLAGFCDAWHEAAQDDPAFIVAQDSVNDDWYYKPALHSAEHEGLQLPISIAFIYDTMTQHGNNDDPKALKNIIAKTNAALGQSPKNGANERQWLAKAIDIREELLRSNSNDDDFSNLSACAVFRDLLQHGNINLSGKIVVKSGDLNHVFTCSSAMCSETQ